MGVQACLFYLPNGWVGNAAYVCGGWFLRKHQLNGGQREKGTKETEKEERKKRGIEKEGELEIVACSGQGLSASN